MRNRSKADVSAEVRTEHLPDTSLYQRVARRKYFMASVRAQFDFQ
jgi:hypothetical protein